MSELYPNAPLVEALCELYFTYNNTPDTTIPGLFYSKVADKYPDKKLQQKIGIEFGLNNPAKPLLATIQQFWNKEQTNLIQLDAERFVINQLAPYPGWEAFSDSVLKIVDIYKDVANVKGISRLNLRYLNKIQIVQNEGKYDIDKYIKGYQDIPAELGLARNFNTSLQFEKDNGKILNVRMQNLPQEATEKNVIIFLDLACSANFEDNFEVQLKEWLSVAHDYIEGAFESLITSECKNTFKHNKN